MATEDAKVFGGSAEASRRGGQIAGPDYRGSSESTPRGEKRWEKQSGAATKTVQGFCLLVFRGACDSRGSEVNG